MKALVINWLRQTKLVRRLNKLSRMKSEYQRLVTLKKMLPVNSLMRDQFDLVIFALTLEFEEQRYWWIKPLNHSKSK